MKKFLCLCFATVTVVATLTACDTSADIESSLQAVRDFHDMIDAEKFSIVYEHTSEDLKKASSQQEFTALLDAVHRKLGKTKSLELVGKSFFYSTSGETITLNYRTTYEQGEAEESFIYQIQDKTALLGGYHINSNALIMR